LTGYLFLSYYVLTTLQLFMYLDALASLRFPFFSFLPAQDE